MSLLCAAPFQSPFEVPSHYLLGEADPTASFRSRVGKVDPLLAFVHSKMPMEPTYQESKDLKVLNILKIKMS